MVGSLSQAGIVSRIAFTLALWLGFTAAAHAQITAASAVNGASFLHSSLPNGKLAPGVLFTIFGSGMGPAALEQISSFPLPTQLAGTSVRVTVQGVTLDCPMVFTLDRQVAAILPSQTPLGPGTLTVSYNGQTSNPLDIEVTLHAFGIFALDQNGRGAGVLAHPVSGILNTLFNSAHPGDAIDIWGTGLGAVAADEALAPAPGDLVNLDVQVFVGDQPAQVTYRGRSGCCAGVDQIRFVVPDGISGCHVPVHVRVNGGPSNYVTMSIAETGAFCTNPGGFSAPEHQIAHLNGGIRSGTLSLHRTHRPHDPASPRSDRAEAFFYRYEPQEILKSNLGRPQQSVQPPGSCAVNQFVALPGIILVHGGLIAGQLSLGGPAGSFNMIGSGLFGSHTIGFVPGGPDVEGVISDGTLLTPGIYSFQGGGGTHVGPFSALADYPQFEWTNMESLQEIDRSQPLTLTWQPGPPGAFVRITGSSTFALLNQVSPSGHINTISLSLSFTCWADAAAGSFTVPPEIIASLPRGIDAPDIDTGSLSLTLWSFSGRFSAAGLDTGRIETSDSISKPMRFR